MAYFVAILNAAVIGMTFLLVKLTLSFANPLDALTYRFAAAFVVMMVPVAFGFVKLGYRGKPILPLLLLASFYPIAYFLLQTFGLQHAASAEGGIISALTPAVTMVFASYFLKETTTLMQKFSLLLSASGIVLIYVMNGSNGGWSKSTGIVLLVLACITLAGYNVLARVVTRRFSAMEISCFMVALAFFTLLAASLGNHVTAGTIGAFAAPLSSPVFLVLTGCLGVIQVATAYMANYVLSRMEASKMSVFSHLSTVIAIGAGALILGESVTWSHLFGAAMIIAGVVGTNMRWKWLRVLPQQFNQTNKARS